LLSWAWWYTSINPALRRIKRSRPAGHWWLRLVILTTWEAEIKRIVVQGQPGKIVHETSSSPK
jgi:hypothetical protein